MKTTIYLKEEAKGTTTTQPKLLRIWNLGEKWDSSGQSPFLTSFQIHTRNLALL